MCFREVGSEACPCWQLPTSCIDTTLFLGLTRLRGSGEIIGRSTPCPRKIVASSICYAARVAVKSLLMYDVMLVTLPSRHMRQIEFSIVHVIYLCVRVRIFREPRYELSLLTVERMPFGQHCIRFRSDRCYGNGKPALCDTEAGRQEAGIPKVYRWFSRHCLAERSIAHLRSLYLRQPNPAHNDDLQLRLRD